MFVSVSSETSLKVNLKEGLDTERPGGGRTGVRFWECSGETWADCGHHGEQPGTREQEVHNWEREAEGKRQARTQSRRRALAQRVHVAVR